MTHQIINDDFLNVRLEKKADLIFADPPYGVTRLDYDKEGAFNLKKLWDFCKENLKPDGVVIMTSVFKFAISVVQSSPKGWFRYDLVWAKSAPTGHLNAKKQPMRSHELILVFSPSGKSTYNPQMTHGHKRKVSLARHKEKCAQSEVYGKSGNVDYDSTDRYPISVQSFHTEIRKGSFHPNQKPVSMMEWIIRTYTNKGELVVDPVAGSCSTMIAAVNMQRECICIEKDKDYFNKAIDRIKNLNT